MADHSEGRREKSDKSEKKAKRQRREEEEAVEEPAVEEVAAEEVEDDEEEVARKAAKAAKKAAKRARKEAEAAEAEAAEAKGSKSDVAASGQKRKRSESTAAADDDATSASGSTGLTWPCYRPSKEVKALTDEFLTSYYTEKCVAVEDPHSSTKWRPIPQFAYAATNFTPELLSCTKSFKEPSPIQATTWPILLSARDIIGIAATGSGKTLAFMMPAIMHIKARRETEGPRSGAGATGKGSSGPVVLVLAPTRELAMQTSAVATEVGTVCGIQSCCIYGGVPKEQQRKEVKTSDVVIATPGRLLDLLEEKALKLSNVTYLVLDEADRMLDMGFEKDIRAILSNLRGHADGRQTLMFSATWPPAIQAIAAEFLHHPVQVTIGSAELAASASVTQICEVVEDPFARDPILLKLLTKYHSSRKNRVLVFVLYKKEAARMESYLQSRGWNCCAIHGDMSQESRTRSFNAFREGKIPLLIATDVAARGLDIPNVEYVINFSFPLTIEDYVHRIGRTGRGGKTGIAHTLFTPLDKAHAGELVNVLREAGAEVPSELLKFGTHVKKKEHSMYGAHFSAAATTGGGAAPAKAHMKFDM